MTEDYYQDDEGGFGYASVGSVMSVPISFIPEGYGSWTFNRAYYFHTDDPNIGNTHNNIVTGTIGVALAF